MKENGHPAPLGDPASGIVLVVEQPVGPRVLEALKACLQAVRLPDAYVTYASTGLLEAELRAIEPHALIAVGPGGAHSPHRAEEVPKVAPSPRKPFTASRLLA